MKIDIFTKENKHTITVYTNNKLDYDVLYYIVDKEYPSLINFKKVNNRSTKLNKNGKVFYSNQVDILEKYAKGV